MSAAQINSRVELAVAAIDAGDFATAKRHLLAAKAYLSARSDIRTGMNSEIRWDRKAIDSLIAQCDQAGTAAAVATTGALRRTKINRVRTTD